MRDTYDPRSLELAEHFLQDVKPAPPPGVARELARVIQRAIEEYLEVYRETERVKSQERP